MVVETLLSTVVVEMDNDSARFLKRKIERRVQQLAGPRNNRRKTVNQLLWAAAAPDAKGSSTEVLSQSGRTEKNSSSNGRQRRGSYCRRAKKRTKERPQNLNRRQKLDKVKLQRKRFASKFCLLRQLWSACGSDHRQPAKCVQCMYACEEWAERVRALD